MFADLQKGPDAVADIKDQITAFNLMRPAFRAGLFVGVDAGQRFPQESLRRFHPVVQNPDGPISYFDGQKQYDQVGLYCFVDQF
jgi:hypothetical protein